MFVLISPIHVHPPRPTSVTSATPCTQITEMVMRQGGEDRVHEIKKRSENIRVLHPANCMPMLANHEDDGLICNCMGFVHAPLLVCLPSFAFQRGRTQKRVAEVHF